MLLGFPLGISGVKGVSLDPELSSSQHPDLPTNIVNTTIQTTEMLMAVADAVQTESSK